MKIHTYKHNGIAITNYVGDRASGKSTQLLTSYLEQQENSAIIISHNMIASNSLMKMTREKFNKSLNVQNLVSKNACVDYWKFRSMQLKTVYIDNFYDFWSFKEFEKLIHNCILSKIEHIITYSTDDKN